jgi:predicted phosphate transport protein (TIGR00153 family)
VPTGHREKRVRWFLPKNADFNSLFDQASANILKGVCLFRDSVKDLNGLRGNVEKLKELEHEGDRLTHKTLDTLNTTFITPFDREDIHALATRLDDILDSVDAAAQRMIVFGIDAVPPRFVKLADLLVESTREVQKAVQALPDRKKRDVALTSCVEINRLENEADVIHREALGELFANSHDAVAVIKLKDLFAFVEEATDRCEDVADVIQTIILKGS